MYKNACGGTVQSGALLLLLLLLELVTVNNSGQGKSILILKS